MTESQVYMWLILDNIKVASLIFTIISIFIMVYISIEIVVNNNKFLMLFWTIPIVSLILSVILPSSKQYAIIKVLPQIDNSELTTKLKQDIPELYDVAINAMKEKFKE